MKKLLILLPLILLCGCWDYTELNMQNYVLGMSIDYLDGEFAVTIETAKITGEPTSLSASEGNIIISRGETVFDAVRNAITMGGKKLYWGHMEIVIISDIVAREHLPAVLDVISRSRDVYPNVDLAVASASTAGDVISARLPSDLMVSVHLSNILANEEPSRRFKRCLLWQLERDLPYTLLPQITLSPNPKILGGGVISKGKLMGYLSGDEVQTFSLLEDGLPGGYLPAVPLDGKVFSLEIMRCSRVYIDNICRVDIVLSLSNSDGSFDMMDAESRKRLETAAEEIITLTADNLMSKTFGNPLTYRSYDIRVHLNSSGLIKR